MRRTPLALGSMQGFLSVVSPKSFLLFVPVFLTSVSEPCPYPSCLCLPSRTSFFHCSAPGSRPQPTKSRWLLSPVPAPLGQWLTLLDWLSLTSDLKGIPSPGYEIFLCKMLGARIGNLLSALSSPGMIAQLCFSLGAPFNAN